MTLYVAPIVEGETEEGCIKIILSRIWRELLAAADREELCVLEPNPAHRSALVRNDHPALSEKVEQSFRRLRSRLRQPGVDRGFLLLLIDADDDCPAKLAPKLLERARAARTDADIVCVLAKRELENWFKAAAESLAGVSGLPDDLSVPANPEDGSGDTWLTRQMQRRNPRRKYTKPGDAVELARRMDLRQCRAHSPSFDKLCRELEARLPQPPDAREPSKEVVPKAREGGTPSARKKAKGKR
jgi:hypothetical protein